jgi:hypothetical protein
VPSRNFLAYFPRRPDFAEVDCGFPLSVGFGFGEKSGMPRVPLPLLPLDGFGWIEGRAGWGMVKAPVPNGLLATKAKVEACAMAGG